MNRTAASGALFTVLLIDDIEQQAARIQDCLQPYRIRVEWRRSYRAAAELLQDPDAGLHVDLVLIDQAFDVDAVPDEDLLTPAEIDAQHADEWDVRLHQGLFVLARLQQDMRDGLVPFVPTMILAQYGRIGIAHRMLGPGGYQTKRRLLTDPYGTLKSRLPQLRPTEDDVDRELGAVVRGLGVEPELAEDVRREVLGGVELEAACAVLARLKDPNDWRSVGLALRGLTREDSGFPGEHLAAALMGRWLASPKGWRRVCHVEELGPLDRGFAAFRVEIGRPDATTYPALLAARAFPAEATPDVDTVRRGSRLVRTIDERSRLFRMRGGRWTILGCWLREPRRQPLGLPGALTRLVALTRHVRDLHARGLAHGSLTGLNARFERPVFGGLRCLSGEQDFDALRDDDLARLPRLATTMFGDKPPPCVRIALERWSSAIANGDLEAGERALAAAQACGGPPAYYDSSEACAGGEQAFCDLLLACLGAEDAILREVRWGSASACPVDFVVCVGGTLAVLDHRTQVERVVVADGAIAAVETGSSQPDQGRLQRSLARCRLTADALAAHIERSAGLQPGSIRRLPAIVVRDGADVRADSSSAWQPVVTQATAIAELTRLSRSDASPSGVAMARCLPAADAWDAAESGSRALRWTAIALGADLLLRRTRRKFWPAESWRELLRTLAAAAEAMLEDGRHPLPLTALQAYDDEGIARSMEADPTSIERVEYGVRIPCTAAPLASWFAEPGTQTGRRRMAAAVLRSLLAWEGSRLAYVSMAPPGLVEADGELYCDLLQFVVPGSRHARRRQRRGGAASIVFLLSPWPYAWPAVLSGTLPSVHESPDERSAWGIAAAAVAALLEPDVDDGMLAGVLAERAELLEAAALLDGRFPAWPDGAGQEALP